MVRDIKEFNFGSVEGKIDSLKWGKDILLICDIKEQFPYAEKCLEYLDSMSEELELRLKKYLFRYFKDYEQDMCEVVEGLDKINEENILKYIQLKSIIVDTKCREDKIEFHIEGECAWEPEHGLEITISDGKILYVGPYEGYSPNSSNIKYLLEEYGYYNQENEHNMNYVDEE